jgi:hypothetical protein
MFASLNLFVARVETGKPVYSAIELQMRLIRLLLGLRIINPFVGLVMKICLLQNKKVSMFDV